MLFEFFILFTLIKKTQKAQTSDFFLLDIFYEHKNVAFCFVFVRLFDVFMVFMLVKSSCKKKKKYFLAGYLAIHTTLCQLQLYSHSHYDFFKTFLKENNHHIIIIKSS